MRVFDPSTTNFYRFRIDYLKVVYVRRTGLFYGEFSCKKILMIAYGDLKIVTRSLL